MKHDFEFATSTFLDMNQVEVLMWCNDCGTVTTIKVNRLDIISGEPDFMTKKMLEMCNAHIYAREPAVV